MPKCVIKYDKQFGEYMVYPYTEGQNITEYEAIVFMKASHYRNMQKNIQRWVKDQDFLEKFFIEAQTAGRTISER